ncbi:hypothetical protein, conserved [Leishmania lindenbergi]|uniref:Uncharacterized protein n=1 Tax=Leishmania lindenbergi TaxID=651832 RepID=A0AAW3AHG8_9TRYP
MPVRSRFMNPLDFLSSSEPLMLTPEEKAEEMAEKARVAELKNDAKALAAALAQELAERKAKTTPAVVTKPRRPAVQAPSRPRRYGTQQQHLPSLPPRSPKLAPVTPRPPRRHKASAKSERARVKTLKRWRKPKPPHRPQTPAAQRAFSIPRERSRSPKMPASTQRSRRKTHQTPQRQSGRQPMRRTAAARIRAAAAAASSRSATSHKPRASRSGKKLPAVRPHRATKVHASVVMRPRSKSTVKTWRLAKSKKRAVVKARCGKRQKAY